MRIDSGFSNQRLDGYFLGRSTRTGGLSGWLLAGVLAFSLTGCGGLNVEHEYPTRDGAEEESDGSIFDWLTLDVFGRDTEQAANDAQPGEAEAAEAETAETKLAKKPKSGLAVNADLWRAALDTVRFMPLASADPIGGTVITDWYNDPGSDKERVKINIVISGLELRADALRVSLFREKWTNRRWVSVAASPRAERQMENIILTRAREFTIMRRDAR